MRGDDDRNPMVARCLWLLDYTVHLSVVITVQLQHIHFEPAVRFNNKAPRKK